MQLQSLTSLRCFAALMVFFSHLFFLEDSESTSVSNVFKHVFQEGYIGVTFFFILSGFILSYSYEIRLKNGDVDYLGFIVARVARIYPLHLVTLIMALPLFYSYNATHGIRFHAILGLNATLLQAYIPNVKVFFSLNLPSWSLSVEMFFYVLFPLLVWMRNWLLAAVICLIVLWQLLFPEWLVYLNKEQLTHFFGFVFPPSRFSDFCIGILLYRYYKSVGNLSVKTASLLQLLSLSLLLVLFTFHNEIDQKFRYDLYYLIPMAMVVFSFAFNEGKFSKAISGKYLVFCGEISFAFYLTHWIVIRCGEYARVRIFHFVGPTFEILASGFYLFATILLSSFLYLLFEKRAKALVLAWYWKIKPS